jgi:hypothetical protein
MIDLQSLPKQIRDMIELKIDTEQTFYRAVEEDYTDIFFETLNARSQVDVQHSYICSATGPQGSGKCILEDTYLNMPNGECIKIKYIRKGDAILDECGDEVVVKGVWVGKKECLRLEFDSLSPVECSYDHKFMTKRGLILARDIRVGDELLTSIRRVKSNGILRDFYRSFFYGAFLADGVITVRKRLVLSKRNPGSMRSNGNIFRLTISNNDLFYLKRLKKIADEYFNFSSVNVLRASGCGRYVLLAYGRDEVLRFVELCGRNSNEKKIPGWIFGKKQAVAGFLAGFANGDLTCNVCKSKKGTYKTEVGFLIKNKQLGVQFLDILHLYGFWPNVRIRKLRSGKWRGNEYMRMTFPAKESVLFLKSIKWINVNKRGRVNYVMKHRVKRASECGVFTTDTRYDLVDGKRRAKVLGVKRAGKRKCVDIGVDSSSHLFQLTGGLVTHNSFAAITACAILDPKFKVDNIFFNYEDLVYKRKMLTPHTAVLVDEQAESYGVDSHRVNIILAALKEQLRKKSIHFFFCSPTLKAEYQSSHFVLETMFIDYETRETYCAYKTRDLLTLGYVRIPHPEGFVGKEFIRAYEAKKDAHLDRLTGVRQIDDVEDWAKKIVQQPLFKKAELIYCKRLGYIPMGMLFQVINKLYPEFKGSVIAGEIATRIKLNKELSGDWVVSGAAKIKKKRSEF